MVRASVYKYAKRFKGMPKKDDFKIIQEDLPDLKDKEFLVQAEYLSVDPYMRSFSDTFKLGDTCIGEQIGRVVESKNEKFPVSEYVLGEFGWRTHTNAQDKRGTFGFPPPKVIRPLGNLPLSLYLGILGMPGHSAYFAVNEICKPKVGETVVISSAGGAVGSHAGQIAKIKGCRVIGITGSDVKGEWLTKELGFDAFVNYKKENWTKTLLECAVGGIDCYFDNVGGEISSAVINNMNKFGRIAVCGCISTYNCDGDEPKSTEIDTALKVQQLQMEGFSVFKYMNRWHESFDQNLQWIREGKLKYKETLYEGFDKMYEAFVGLLTGENIGKSIVKV